MSRLHATVWFFVCLLVCFWKSPSHTVSWENGTKVRTKELTTGKYFLFVSLQIEEIQYHIMHGDCKFSGQVLTPFNVCLVPGSSSSLIMNLVPGTKYRIQTVKSVINSTPVSICIRGQIFWVPTSRWLLIIKLLLWSVILW